MNERDIHKAVYDYLTAALPPGSICWTVPGGDGARTMAPRYRAGSPDILFCRNGCAYAVEVKGPRGRQSPEQQAEQALCERAGVPYAVVHGVDEMAETLLRWGIAPRARAA